MALYTNTPIPFQSGFRLIDGQGLDNALAYPQKAVASGLTAIGTTGPTGLALAAPINQIATAAASTGVALPQGPGAPNIVDVFNDGANPITVYTLDGSTIDGTAGATGVPLTNAKRCRYYRISPTAWESAQLGVVSA